MDKVGVGETTTASSGPGFFTGLAFGVLLGGALSALLFVGYTDEMQRRQIVGRAKADIQRRRSAGYAYEKRRR